MTNDMFGIDSMRICATTSTVPVGDQVLPFQGVDDLFGTISQGVALGCRVVAPLARKTNESWIEYQGFSPNGAGFTDMWRHHCKTENIVMSPDGAEFISPGQRPGEGRNIASSPDGAEFVSPGQRPGNRTNIIISPERAKPVRLGQCSGNTVNMVVSPLQGGNVFMGTFSQGVALGCRVIAPLARKTNESWIEYQGFSPNGAGFTDMWRHHCKTENIVMSPYGAEFISPGQRPREGRNIASSPYGAEFISPGQRPREGRNIASSPDGAEFVSPGQRPGNTAKIKTSPERAKPVRLGQCSGNTVNMVVSPLQGGNVFMGPFSQGVALGCRVVAPLARKTNESWIGYQGFSPNGAGFTDMWRHHCKTENIVMSPYGAEFISPGQRPGNRTNIIFSPERAKHVRLGQRPGNTVNMVVSPLQGGNVFMGPFSQGGALGCRVVAPLARKNASDKCGKFVYWQCLVNPTTKSPSPYGAKFISPGQRPGNRTNIIFSPERAKHHKAIAIARKRIENAGGNKIKPFANVAEIREE